MFRQFFVDDVGCVNWHTLVPSDGFHGRNFDEMSDCGVVSRLLDVQLPDLITG